MTEDSPPVWRAMIIKALHLHRSKPEAKYVQLATVAQHKPSNRTLVFRGFNEASQLLFFTDTRSNKYMHLSEHAYASACWYFSKSREQFRLDGPCQLLTQTDEPELVTAHWKRLSNNGKQTFLGPAPGSEQSEDTIPPSHTAYESCPNSFAIIALQPERVDYLKLSGEAPQRMGYTLDADLNWQARPLVP